ncbi:hypothetical protein T08_15618 [Trichinella sp. T8]|nr:hypothetical protein T08_15618 [Trichinella sp. T8]
MNVDFPHDNSRTTFSYVMIVSAAYYVATINSAAILKRHFATGQHNKIVRILSCAGSLWGFDDQTRRINHFVVVDGVGSEFVRACDQVKCEYRRRSYDLDV